MSKYMLEQENKISQYYLLYTLFLFESLTLFNTFLLTSEVEIAF